MATYIQLQRISEGLVPDAYDQVKWAITVAATAVEAEDPGTTNHIARLKWARNWRSGRVRTSFAQYMQLLLQIPAAESGIGGTDNAPTVSWTDGAVQTAINARIDLFASLP